jgi:hypothetical protein
MQAVGSMVVTEPMCMHVFWGNHMCCIVLCKELWRWTLRLWRMLAPTDLLSESSGSAAATATHLQDRPHLVGWCNGQQRNHKDNCAH